MTEVAASKTDVLVVDVQMALDESDVEEPPSSALLTAWANQAYAAVATTPTEVTIRLVEVDEIRQLNNDYRGKDQATNVLSFPFEVDPDIEVDLLGDIVICHDVLCREAAGQDKSLSDHYAHMVTHGVLHLCGYDHQDDATAAQMEQLETTLLAQQGIADPY